MTKVSSTIQNFSIRRCQRVRKSKGDEVELAKRSFRGFGEVLGSAMLYELLADGDRIVRLDFEWFGTLFFAHGFSIELKNPLFTLDGSLQGYFPGRSETGITAGHGNGLKEVHRILAGHLVRARSLDLAKYGKA